MSFGTPGNSVGQGGGTALVVSGPAQSWCWGGSVSFGPVVIAELLGFVLLFGGARADWKSGQWRCPWKYTKTREMAGEFLLLSHVL